MNAVIEIAVAAPSEVPAEYVAGSVKPMCFDTQEQWELWKAAADTKATRPMPDAGHCEDCLPAYQARMKAEGRCARPLVFFEPEDGEGGKGGLVGRMPKARREARGPFAH